MVREADGIILATPGYHGSLSGVVKNALDTLELTRDDAAPYFQGKPVGIIITADGAQAAGTTLMAVRAIIHAMRGWPTPFGAALNAKDLFDDAGECREAKDAWQLDHRRRPGHGVRQDESQIVKRPYLVDGAPPQDEFTTSALSPIEDIIEDARNGRPYILVDAEDRENEGDIIIPAQFATPEQINFMAKHARGLICLSITAERARQRLPPMATDNQSGHGTAFTVSIEAREGVTTGISAHDRAHTIAVAVDPTKGVDDIVSPGHVSRWWPRTAACWSAPATPRPRWTSRAWPASTPPG